ncbi:type 4a pilus biogenesis protein PilO [Desulfocicer niacini]
MSRMHRILICAFSFITVGAIFYYFFYMPRHEEMSRLSDEQTRLKNQLDLYKSKAALLSKFTKKMAEAQNRFDSAMTALPEKKEIPSLLTEISNSGNNSGLEFMLFQPRSELKTEFYAEIPVDIKVQGTYHQMGSFFDKVSRLHRIVNIKDITMMPGKQEGSLFVTCTAVTYMFVEKQENKGKKK